MGNLRFTLGAIQQIMQGKTHQAHIAVLPLAQADTILQHAAVDDSAGGALQACLGLRHVLCRELVAWGTCTVVIVQCSVLSQAVDSLHEIDKSERTC